MAVFISESEEESLKWARGYAATLEEGDVVLLEGEMGAGKTVLAKGIAQGLGIRAEVTSPTYAYINSYGDRLFHFDCYRVPNEAYAEALGFPEYFGRGICLVEWSEKIAGLLPKTCKTLRIIKRGEHLREIEF